MIDQSDYSDSQTFSYWADGSQKTDQAPGENAQQDNSPEPNAGQPQTITLPNGGTETQVFDGQGNLVSQSGAGTLAATMGYDTSGTGQMTSLTTASGTTRWSYDQNTGQLQSKTYADGTQDTYKYNDNGQLANVFEPGVTGSLSYDAAGNQIGSTYTDSVTGVVQSATQLDDQGRPQVTTSTDNGQSSTEVSTYNVQGDPQGEIFGSAGGTTVSKWYYSISGYSSTGTPDGLQTMTVTTPSQSVSQGYTYNATSKRLQTITINGITLTYNYLSNSNQISSITVGNVTTTYNPDSSDGARLGSMAVSASGSDELLYDATYGYNQNDQITSADVTQTTVADDGTTSSGTNNYGYTYDASQANALTQVTDNGATTYSYGYDGVGNFTGNSALGSANSVNQYSNLTYNARGDLTNDGTYTYGYDALDRLISITPNSPTTGSTQEQYGYDGQGRMLWENVSTWNTSSSSWTATTTYHYVWSGDELIDKLDANNNVLQAYTWGPGENGTNEVIALTDYTGSSPKTYALIYDASGNVTMTMDATTGAVVASYSYTPYGALISATGPQAGLNPFRGKGYWTDPADPEVGQAQPSGINGKKRDDNFVVGTWMENDPSGIAGGLNPNQVDGGDPINKTDPNGLAPWSTREEAAFGVTYDQFESLAHDLRVQGAGGFARNQARQIIANASGGLSLQGLSNSQIIALAQSRIAASTAAQQSVLSSGYDPSKGMAGRGAAVGQGVINDVQGLQNFAIGIVNLGWAEVWAPLRAVTGHDIRIPSPDWSKDRISNEYGNHGFNVGVANVGWSLVVPSILGKVLPKVAPAAENTAARVPTGDTYSVAFQTELDATSYTGVSRGAHFQEANENLLQAMESDPQFAQTMQGAGVNLQRTPTGLAPRTPPAGWTWHHAEDPGVLQLVPRVQHTPGSIFWDTLHPGGQGGYAIWGK